MDLLGDFGGFYEALFLIIGSVGLLYNSQFFRASIAEELNYQDEKQNISDSIVKDNEISNIVAKIYSENILP